MADATRRVSVRLSLDDSARVKAGRRAVGEAGQGPPATFKGGAESGCRGLAMCRCARARCR